MGPLDPAPPPGAAAGIAARSPQNTPKKHRAGPPRPGLELTIHGFLLEEGRHGQGQRPGGPARPGPVRDWERTGGKGQARGGFGVAKPKESEEGRSPGRTRRGGTGEAYRSRLSRNSGDCELRHFLEKSLLGGACALQLAPAH